MFGVLDFSRTTFLILYFRLGASWFLALPDMTTTITIVSGKNSWLLFGKSFILNLGFAIFKDK